MWRGTDRQNVKERENMYNDLKDLKRRMGVVFEKDLPNRNRKQKMAHLFQCIFVGWKWKISISTLSVFIHRDLFSSSVTQFSVVVFLLALYFVGLSWE